MIDFVRFYFCIRLQKRLTNPETLIKVNIHISGSVKTLPDFGTRHGYMTINGNNALNTEYNKIKLIFSSQQKYKVLRLIFRKC